MTHAGSEALCPCALNLGWNDQKDGAVLQPCPENSSLGSCLILSEPASPAFSSGGHLPDSPVTSPSLLLLFTLKRPKQWMTGQPSSRMGWTPVLSASVPRPHTTSLCWLSPRTMCRVAPGS